MAITCNQCTWIRSKSGTETYIAVWLAPRFNPTTGCLDSDELDVWACINQESGVYANAPGAAAPTKLTGLKVELDLSIVCGNPAFRLSDAIDGIHATGGNEGQPAFLLANHCQNSPGNYPIIELNAAQGWYVNLQAAAPTHVAVLKFKDASCETSYNAVKIGTSAPLIQFTENGSSNTHGMSTQNPANRHWVQIQFASGNTTIEHWSEVSGQTGIGATNTHNTTSNNHRFVLGPPIGGANSVYPIELNSAGTTCTVLYKDWAMLKYTDEGGTNGIANNPGYFLDMVAAAGDSAATLRAGYSADCSAKGFSKVQFRFGYKSGVSNTPPSDSGITINALAGGVAKNAAKGWTTSLSSAGKAGDVDWYDVTMSSPEVDGAPTKPIYDWDLYTYVNGGGNDVFVSASFAGGTMRNTDSFVICTAGLDVRMSNNHGSANSAGDLCSGGNLNCTTLAASCTVNESATGLDYCVDSAQGGSAADCPDWVWSYQDDVTAGVYDTEAAIGFGCYEEGGGQVQADGTVIGGSSSFKIYACRVGNVSASFTHVDGLTTKLLLPEGVYISSMTSPFSGVATYTSNSDTPTITLSASNSGERIDMSSPCESELCKITLAKQINLDSDIEQPYPAAPPAIDWYVDDYWSVADGSTPFSHSLSVVPALAATVLTSSKYEASQVMQCKQFPNMQLQLGPWMDRVTAPVTGGCFITPGIHSASAVWGTGSYPQYGYGHIHLWLEPVLTGSSAAVIAHSDGVAGHYITDEVDVKYSQAESHGIDHIEFGIQVQSGSAYHHSITGSLVDPPGYTEVLIAGAIAVDNQITLTSRDPGGSTLAYTAKGAANFSVRQFDQSGNIAATALSLKDAINHANGHNGKIIASVKDSGAGNGNDTVVLEQKPALINDANGGYSAIVSTLANTTVLNGGFIANNVHKNGGRADIASAAWTAVTSTNSNISCSFFDLQSTTRGSDIFAKTGTLCRIRLGSATASSEPWVSVWSNSGSAYYDPSPSICINKDRLWAYQADDKPDGSTKWLADGNPFSQPSDHITPPPASILTPSVFPASYPRLGGSQYTGHGYMTGVKITAKLSQSVTAYEFKLKNVPVLVDSSHNIKNAIPYWNWNFGHDNTNADPDWSGSVQQGWSYVDTGSYVSASGTPLTGTVDVWVAGFITGSKTADSLPSGSSKWIGTLLYKRYSSKHPDGTGWSSQDIISNPTTPAKLAAVTVEASSIRFYGGTDEHSEWMQTSPEFNAVGGLLSGTLNRCNYDGGIHDIGDMDSTSLVSVNALGGPYNIMGTTVTFGTASTGENACGGTITTTGSTLREGWMASHKKTVTQYGDFNGVSYGTHWKYLDCDHTGIITVRDLISQRRYLLNWTNLTGSFNTSASMGYSVSGPTTGSSISFPRYTYAPLMPPPVHHVPVLVAKTTACPDLVPVAATLALTPCQLSASIKAVDWTMTNRKTTQRGKDNIWSTKVQIKTEGEYTHGGFNADAYLTGIELIVEGFRTFGKKTGSIIETPIPKTSDLFRGGCTVIKGKQFTASNGKIRQVVTIWNPGLAAIQDPSVDYKDFIKLKMRGPFEKGKRPRIVGARLVTNGHDNPNHPCGDSNFDTKLKRAPAAWTGIACGNEHVCGKSMRWIRKLVQSGEAPSTGAKGTASLTFHTTRHKAFGKGTLGLTAIDAIGTRTLVTYALKNDGTANAASNEVNACANRNGTVDFIAAAINGDSRGKMVFSGFPNNDEEFTLTDAANSSATFIFKGGVQTADGSQAGGKYIIGLSALGTVTDLATRIATVINIQTAAAITAATGAGTGVLNLRQDTTGAAGDKNIVHGVNNVVVTNFTGGGAGHNGKITAVNAGSGVLQLTQASIVGVMPEKLGDSGNTKIEYSKFKQVLESTSTAPGQFSGAKIKTIQFWAKNTAPTANDRFDIVDLIAVYKYYQDRVENIGGEMKAYAPGTNSGPSLGTVMHVPTDQCGTPFCNDMPV